MNNLERMIRLIHERLDSPIMRVGREIQEKLDVFQSPAIKAVFESNNRIQEFTTSPTLKAIMEVEDKFRLSVSPQFQTMLEQNERMKDMIDPSGISKITKDLSAVSKWASTTDTPISVFKEVSTFSKVIEQVNSSTWKMFDYQGFIDKINRDAIGKPFIEPMFNADFWKSYRYTLIDEDEVEPETGIILLDEGSRAKRLISEIYNNNQKLFTLKPADFEDMIAELLKSQQFEVEMTKRTRDGGVDLIAIKNAGEFPVRFLVECKRFSKKRKVSVDIVRGFRDVVNTHGANMGIIVTSSYFSPDAQKDRQKYSPYLLDFKDHDDVIRWVNQYVD